MDTSDRPDIPAMQWSVGQRKDWLANQVKNLTNTDHILKRILDVQVLVTVRELLGGMPELHQRVFQPMKPPWTVSSQEMKNGPEVNAMVYETNAMQERNDVIDQIMRGEALYTVGTLRVAVYLRHDPAPYTVMLDNGAEINVMYSLMAAKLGLVMMELNHGLMTSANQSKS